MRPDLTIIDDVVGAGCRMTPISRRNLMRWYHRFERSVISKTHGSFFGGCTITTITPRPWWSRLGLVFKAMLSVEGRPKT